MRFRPFLPVLALGLLAAAPVASVVDGDTFVLGAARVRLWGVDAPEGRQICQDAGGRDFRCGDSARDRLKALIGSGRVDCRERDRDGYGRMVAQCRVASVDLGEAMVRAGWAIDYRQFSRGAYAVAEGDARAAKRGLWAGRFEAPDRWRAEERTQQPSQSAAGGCAIKGNISANGRKIFHIPGQRDYAATVIDTARGERWFCNQAQAVAAGWAPAAR